ncbi:hypothetical protein FO519_006860 [Halicephalobus sp. NKZ332]|nr:hypothetical protein FO519_006860 [Halicephalobus sp. NKZ332]
MRARPIVQLCPAKRIVRLRSLRSRRTEDGGTFEISFSSVEFLEQYGFGTVKFVNSFVDEEETRKVEVSGHLPKKTIMFISRFVINAVVGTMVTVFAAVAMLIYWPGNGTGRYDWPAPSYSLMGKFKKAAVTCDHGLCSEIGRDILIKGGNAIEASIASMLCLGITNPQSSGIGGGFILTMYNRTTQKCHVIDARETAPGMSTKNMFRNDSAASKYGWRAIATPGEIAGYWMAFQKFGSGNVTWKELVQPSVELARHGVPISEYLGRVLKVKEKQEWINPATGMVYEYGDIIQRPILANTLEEIGQSDDPVQLFYHGKFADIIAKEFAENGGILTKDDLEKYAPKFYETALVGDPIHEDIVACGPPPPSSFAIAYSIIAVGTMEYCDHSKERPWNPWNAVYDDPTYYHFLIESHKFAYAQRTKLGDADFVPEALEIAMNMTTKDFTEWIFSRRTWTPMPPEHYLGNGQAHPEDHGTSHVSVVDQYGNGVSATSTVNRWFGSSVQSPQLGIVWNDEMDDFSTPGMSNGFGFAPSETNFIEPGKRPMSSMSPMILYHQNSGELKMVIGASGGSKIISAVARPVVRVLCFNETIKQAIDAPALHNQFTPDETQYESDVPKQLLEDLRKHFGHKLVPTTGFEAIVQGIVIGDDGFIYANGDHRRKTNMHPEGF